VLHLRKAGAAAAPVVRVRAAPGLVAAEPALQVPEAVREARAQEPALAEMQWEVGLRRVP
jgi:hypothetical protein